MRHILKKRPGVILSILYASLLLLILFIFISSNILNIPIEHFSADLAAVYGAHPFEGMLSNIGVLLWCTTAAVCIFSFIVSNSRRRGAYFLLWSGIITAVLLIDDLFQLHEAILPWYFNIPEGAVYGVYILLISGYLAWFWREIIKTDYNYLVIACMLLGFSVVCDMILPQEGIAYLIEDGFKIFGIVTWFFYYTRTCYKEFSEGPVVYQEKHVESVPSELYQN